MNSGTISGEFLRNSRPNSASSSVRYSKTAATSPVPRLEIPASFSVVTNEVYFYSKEDEELGRSGREEGTVDPVELNLFVSFGRQVAAGMVQYFVPVLAAYSLYILSSPPLAGIPGQQQNCASGFGGQKYFGYPGLQASFEDCGFRAESGRL